MSVSTQPSPAQMQSFVEDAFADPATAVPQPIALEVLEGELPADLRGVVYRNGPGRFERGGVRYGHPFDGDGFVQRFEFDGSTVRYRARFVHTREFLDEEAAGRIVHRGFGTAVPGGFSRNAFRLRFKNAANTHIVPHAGRLLALWEGGLPHRLDPDTLETLERFDFDGALRNDQSFIDRLLNPELPFAAHPTVDPRTGELWCFGTAYGARNRLLVYRVDAEGMLHTRSIALSDLPFIHDFALTERFAVFVAPRVGFDVPRTLAGLTTPVDSLTLEDAPGEALIVPRDGSGVIRIPVLPGFVFHWAAAWEEDSRVVLDGVKYDRFPQFSDVGGLFGEGGAPEALARLVRIELDLETRTATERTLGPHAVELPVAQGDGPARTVFATAAPVGRPQPFLSGLVRVDAEGTHLFRDLGLALPGEPLLAGEWLVVQVRTAPDRSELWVLDPADLQTVCRLAMPAPVPPALHGTFVSAQELAANSASRPGQQQAR